jgi:hypothetical protein
MAGLTTRCGAGMSAAAATSLSQATELLGCSHASDGADGMGASALPVAGQHTSVTAKAESRVSAPRIAGLGAT